MQTCSALKTSTLWLCGVVLLGVLVRQDAQSFGVASGIGSQDAAQRASDEISAMRCNDRNASGVGLQGSYFDRPGARGKLLLSRVDTTVEFDASRDWPAELPLRPGWVRWQGWVKAPLTGRYRFHGGPGATIHVSGLPMAGASAPPDASLEMSAGSYYPILMEADLREVAALRLEWTAPHGGRYVVPRALLFLPSAS